MRALMKVLASLLACTCVDITWASQQGDLAGLDAGEIQAIVSRIGDPPDAFLDMFGPKGSPDRSVAHNLSEAEIADVRAALTGLTPVQRKVLQQHLASLSFADGMPNNALTYPVDGRHGFFNITVRSVVFRETISQLLNEKENACFANEDADNRIVIDAGKLPALTYILLHESTHVVDASMGLSGDTAKANGLA